MNIKKGDQVQVIAGKDKGKKGTVEKVLTAENRLIVSNIHVRKYHLKPSQARPKGGITEMPAPFSRANVMVICPHCSALTRGKHLSSDKGTYRACAKCGTSIDQT